jgi:S1-C subfamily serine protease
VKTILIDSINDLALLVPFAALKGGFEFESEDSISVGNQIYSWGFPFQYSSALLTVGYIAGFRIYVPDNIKPNNVVKHIVFNGAFNPGNSGGPMIDSRGKIVGIVQSKAIPLSDDAISGLKAQSSNISGFPYTHTDNRGKTETLSEAQVIAMILDSYQKIAQVMIGEGVSIEEVKEFLHKNHISGF